MIFRDYYKILGLDTNKVSIDEIKIAFREQAKKYHPDVNMQNKKAEERFNQHLQVEENMIDNGMQELAKKRK